MCVRMKGRVTWLQHFSEKICAEGLEPGKGKGNIRICLPEHLVFVLSDLAVSKNIR